jgi:hypothetical protein
MNPKRSDRKMAEDKLTTGEFDWRSFTPEDSPKTPMDVMADPNATALRTPDLSEGDEAYDFKSHIYDYTDGTEKSTGKMFHLSSVAGEKPVALIFGSYT